MNLLADAPWTLIAADAGSVPLSMGTGMLVVVLVTIFVALVFDFLNGFHDAANSIATVVSTRVLSPRLAVAWAAFFNFAAAFVFGTHVAQTIGTGLVETRLIDVYVVCGGLLGAITWNIITWLLGLPTSSSHALVAGIAGAAIAKGGFIVLIMHGWVLILLGIVLSPALGFALGSLNLILVSWLFRRATPHKVDGLFRRLQLVSAALYSLGHGGNDAQKTMGIITLALIGSGDWTDTKAIPFWVKLSAASAIALGTWLGGWRIIRMLGKGVVDIAPVQGMAAQSSAAATILASSQLGFALSTTHVATGSVVGSGLPRIGGSSVRWGVVGRMVAGWLITLPAAGFTAAVMVWISKLFGNGVLGAVIVMAILIGFSTYMWFRSRHNAVGHHNVNDDWEPGAKTATPSATDNVSVK